jgi:hypothetical protein
MYSRKPPRAVAGNNIATRPKDIIIADPAGEKIKIK